MTVERAINLLAGQCNAYGDCMSKEEIEAFRMAIDALKKCGTDDVIPVVHGKWIWLSRKEAKEYAPLGIVTDNENWVCSICQKYGTGRWWKESNKYCPNCGSKMDGK